MPETTAGLDAVVEPPNTKLTEMLTVFQDLFRKHPSFQLMTELEVLAKLIDEPRNVEEITRFVDAYLFSAAAETDGERAFARARKGMAVMAILGYMVARGEAKVKGMLL